MIKFEKIKPGMTLYDRHKYVMGNTTIKTIGEWTVFVVSVDESKRTAVCQWNGNKPTTWYERDLRKLYDWSMRDECAEVVRSSTMGVVFSVRKKKVTK